MAKEQLIEVLKSYKTMIERNGKEHPTICLDDIYASIKFILEKEE